MNAKRDQNDVPVALGVSSSDGVTPIMLAFDPITNYLLAEIHVESLTATQASKDKIDENDIKTVYGVSSVDGTTLVPIRTNSLGYLLAENG